MTEKQSQLQQLVQNAISHFNANEKYLIENRLCERCICAKFAMYLERVISRSFYRDYTIDVEYDRGMGGNDYGKKRICNHDAYLDLIVHKRGYDEFLGYDNLIAIEMKWQNEDFEEDKERLKILVDNANGFNYRISFAIRIIANPDKNIYKLVIEDCYCNALDF